MDNEVGAWPKVGLLMDQCRFVNLERVIYE